MNKSYLKKNWHQSSNSSKKVEEGGKYSQTYFMWLPLMLGGIGGRRRRGQQRMRWLDGIDRCESGWTPGVGDGQGDLACCDSWGHKELDTTEQLNWTELNWGTWTHRTVRYNQKVTLIPILAFSQHMHSKPFCKVNYCLPFGWNCTQVH